MSWFTKDIEHPFVAAVTGLLSNPAITQSPEAAGAVAQAKATAESIASTATSTAVAVVASVASEADPAIQALGNGLQTALDAYLTAALGPLGAALAGPAANTIIALGEKEAHDLIAALFSHAKASLPVTK